MSNLPPPFVPKGGIRPRGPRGGPRGGARGGPRGGPRGGGQFNNNNLRGGYAGHQGFAPNGYGQAQMPQGGGYFDPFGNWILNQPFHAYNNNSNGYPPHQPRNNQWRNDQQSEIPADDATVSLASLKTKYNKTQGQLLAMKDETEELKTENQRLIQENAELRERSGNLIRNVTDFGQMMKELEAKNKLLKAQLDRARGKEVVGVEEGGVKLRKVVAVEDEVDGLLIKGHVSGKIQSDGKDEGSDTLVPTKQREKCAMKSSSEAMKALVETGSTNETENETNEDDDAGVTEEEVEEEVALEETEIDFTLAVPANAEDEIDWDYDELDEVEEAVVPEIKAEEVKTKKRKVSEDRDAGVLEKRRKVSENREAHVVEKKPRRARNRK
ncbi:hypothetical protein Vi05172_g6675 [Venturia inaequalis]|uniref:Uncharacterized protein n=1 Tax=Venturia inaequalis TaxID=5025 RepID=A0A8H3ZAZ7_VENIN|nr:hypothetical protein EG327_004587 [Venturia inaequalis]RDI83439.1 hypothetical protein Vi05172_g6675 [Venturia inaequalis]